jgi:uncharacterized protein YjbJ (UPF0337 family)
MQLRACDGAARRRRLGKTENRERSFDMNWTHIEGKWDQLKGDAKTRWARLTDDDIKLVHGQFETLVGKVVERYGIEKELARRQVHEWADRLAARLEALGHAAEEHPSGNASPARRHHPQQHR